MVSNVPGTPERRYLAGCAITEQMFWVPPQAGDIGLGVSIVSYAGQVQFGVVADEASWPILQIFSMTACRNSDISRASLSPKVRSLMPPK